MKRKAMKILLALVLVLSIALVTATPAVADDGAHFVNSGGQWHAAVTPYGPMGGNFQFHGKVATDGQPAKGFMHAQYTYGVLAGSWYRMEVEAIKIIQLDGKPAAWSWGQVVAGELVIDGQSQGDYTGYKVLVFVDGGTPGRDVDYAYVGTIPDAGIAQAIYQSEDISDPNLLPIDVVQGNIVIK